MAPKLSAPVRTAASIHGGDLPRYVELVERKLFDAKSMITATFRFEDSHKAYQAVADRTIIGAVVTFT